MKDKLIKLILIIVSLIISFVSCYFYFDKILDKFNGILGSNMSYIILRLFVAAIIFLVFDSLIKGKFSKSELNIFFIAYFVLILMLSLFKYGTRVDASINLNPLSIVDDFNYMSTTIVVIANLLMYIPVGVGIKLNFNKIKNYKLSIVFLIYILIVESIQYIFKLGIFDIDDIILNFIGFYIGIFILDKYLLKTGGEINEEK